MQKKWYAAVALVAVGLSLQGCGEEDCQIEGQIGPCQPCSSVDIGSSVTCEALCRSGSIKFGCGTPGGSADCRDELAEPASEWGGDGSCSCIGVGDGDVKEHIRVCTGGEAEPARGTMSDSSRTSGGSKEEPDQSRSPLQSFGSFAGGALMIIGALACLVTGKAPDKGKGCFQVSTREENPCNWYCNVVGNGVFGVAIIVWGIMQLTSFS